MNGMPLSVLAVYAGLAVWPFLLLRDYRSNGGRGAFATSLLWGIALALFLNLRYLIDGAADGIAFFVSLYDVFDNLGLAAGDSARALGTCPDNGCSLWGDRYLNHSTWGVAFHDRFLNGPALRSNLLYAHLVFNSIVFVLMHIQIAKPPVAGNATMHRTLGRVSAICLTLGTVCAVWLASEMDPIGPYGGPLAKWGFWSMSLCVYGCAVMGVVAIRGGDMARHRVWMIRFAGSMWGAFWLFRVMLIVTGPLLRDYETVSLLLSIWLSAPLGIVLAEWLRRHLERRAHAPRLAAGNAAA